MNTDTPARSNLETEIAQFASSLLKPNRRKVRRTGPPPVITFDAICRHVAHVVDRHGPAAATARQIAEDLEISTRTLYKRISSHDNMIRRALEIHYSGLDMAVGRAIGWPAFAAEWGVALHRHLVAHPHLTELTTGRDLVCRQRYFDELVEVAGDEGLDDPAGHCRRLVDLIVGDAIMKSRDSAGKQDATADFEVTLLLVLGVTTRRFDPCRRQ